MLNHHNVRHLLLSALLSACFTIAIIYATFELPKIIHLVLIKIFPDFGLIPYKYEELINAMRPYGYAALVVFITIIVIGILLRKSKFLVSSSIAMNLTLFGYFAGTMFVFAGLGILRLVWLPLVDMAIIRLGDVCLLPLFLFLIILYSIGYPRIHAVFFKVIHTSANIIMILGVLIIFVSVATWLYGKFRGVKLVDFGIYEYIRHPQYLGFIVYSYGLLLAAIMIPFPRGGYFPAPTLPWLLAFMTIITAALFEEISLMKTMGDTYKAYMERTHFMIPLPKFIKKVILLPIRLLFKKNYPERRIEVLVVILLYTILLILLSIPFTSLKLR